MRAVTSAEILDWLGMLGVVRSFWLPSSSCGDELLGSVAALVAFGIAAEKAASISRVRALFRGKSISTRSRL